MKIFRVLSPLFLWVLSSAFLPASAEEPAWNIRTVPLERVTVVAHRGAGHLAPENTLSALELTWSMGGAPETDIRTTKDGHLVMFHDNNFKRILPNAPEEMKNKRIEDLTWAEVEQLDIGAFRGEKFKGQKVISLAELVEALKKDRSRQVFIDVKNVDFSQLARETEGVHEQVILATGSDAQTVEWKKLVPISDAFLWMGLGAGDDKLAPRIETLKENHFGSIDRMQIHVNFDENGKTTPSEEFLRTTAAFVHKNYPNVEFQLMPWNAPEKKEYYWKLADLGAGGFGTDRPDVAFEALREYYEQGSTADWNVRDHIALDQVIVQAHRGFGDFGPEGSDDSFRRAWEMGLVPEADLRLTKDKKIVSFHDNDFYRILPNAPEEMKKKKVADLTLEEVKALDIGSFRGEEFKGQRALSLAEIVEALKADPKKLVYLDIKDVDFDQLAAESVSVHRQIIVASTVYDQILAWKKAAPRSWTIHWMGGTEEQLRKRIAALKEKDFHGIDQLQIHMNIDSAGNCSPSLEFMREVGTELRKRGILFQSLIWEKPGSVAENYHRLMDAGVASFATDYPEATMKAIRDYYEKK